MAESEYLQKIGSYSKDELIKEEIRELESFNAVKVSTEAEAALVTAVRGTVHSKFESFKALQLLTSMEALNSPRNTDLSADHCCKNDRDSAANHVRAAILASYSVQNQILAVLTNLSNSKEKSDSERLIEQVGVLLLDYNSIL